MPVTFVGQSIAMCIVCACTLCTAFGLPLPLACQWVAIASGLKVEFQWIAIASGLQVCCNLQWIAGGLQLQVDPNCQWIATKRSWISIENCNKLPFASTYFHAGCGGAGLGCKIHKLEATIHNMLSAREQIHIDHCEILHADCNCSMSHIASHTSLQFPGKCNHTSHL